MGETAGFNPYTKKPEIFIPGFSPYILLELRRFVLDSFSTSFF